MTISPLRDRYELAIIGARPAGMAAATTAAGLGIDAVLLDEQPSPGGQVYREITEANPRRRVRHSGRIIAEASAWLMRS